MKKNDITLLGLGCFCLLFAFVFEVIAKDCTEWFSGASEFVSVLVNISLSLFSGCIIYFISCYLPSREIERRGREKQIKIDEIVAVHLSDILVSMSEIFVVAYGYNNDYQSILLEPLDEAKFSSMAKNINPRDTAVIPNYKKDPKTGMRIPMTVEEYIDYAIENIVFENKNLSQFERFLSIDLIKTIWNTKKNSIISDWGIMVSDEPEILSDGKKLYLTKVTLGSYSAQFKSLDELFRLFQKEILLLQHTEAGKQYGNHIQTPTIALEFC